MRLPVFFSSMAFLLAIAACSGASSSVRDGASDLGLASEAGAPGADAGGDDVGFSFEAAVDGVLPEGASVVVVWPSDGSTQVAGDYLWVFGRGEIVKGRARIHFPSAPPPEALNGGQLGGGSIFVVDASIPDGVLVNKDAATGHMSVDHIVVYRVADHPTYKPWSSAFPLRAFACGRCVRSGDDERLSTHAFEPDDCSHVRISALTPERAPCDWR